MQIELSDMHVRIHPQGLESFFSFKTLLELPLAEIEKVQAVGKGGPKPEGLWSGIRIPGSFAPWILRAGTYYSGRRWEYWWYPWNAGYLDIQLRPRRGYSRAVVAVEDPEAWAARLQEAGLPREAAKR